MGYNGFQKAFSFISALSIFLQALSPLAAITPSVAYAQEATPIVTSAADTTSTPTPTTVQNAPTPSPTDTSTPTLEVTVVPSPTNTLTPTPTITPTPTQDFPSGTNATSATITTDKADYGATDVVTITGNGFATTKTYTIEIVSTDSPAIDFTNNVSTDTTGAFTYKYQLDGNYRPNYSVYVKDSSNIVAKTTFTDKPAASLDQCANLGTTCDTTNPAQWQNGDLNGSQADYFEGDSVPYRAILTGLTSGETYTTTIQWDTTKAGKHAVDYLTSYNRTEISADPCSGLTCGGSTNTVPIPTDANVTKGQDQTLGTGDDITQIPGSITVFGGTNLALIGSYVLTGTYAGDSSTSITVSFKADVNGTAVLAWGGHIATRHDWGLNNSAVSISGSPYHMALTDFTCSNVSNCSVGSQDRALTAAAVIFPGSITIVKQATPEGSTSFPFSASPSPLTNFSLVDNGTSANTKVFSNITNFQTYTINETPLPSGWAFDAITCTVTSANGGTQTASGSTETIVLKEGENVTCTYTNHQLAGTLIVKKHVINDNGGTATASAFNLHVKSGSTDVSNSPAAGSEIGTSYSLTQGSYTVSEDAFTGYTQTGFSGDCDSSGNVTVTAGTTKTCTITNNDNAPQLHLRKTITNDNGGTAKAADWTLSATGTGGSPTNLSGTTPVDSDSTFKADTYALAEINGPSGYTPGAWDCGGATMPDTTHVTVPFGGNVTCTINNNDTPPSLTLIKQVTNDNGGTNVAADWTLSATGPTSLSGSGEATSDATFSAGTYDLSETGPNDYTPSNWVCTGTGTQNGAQITLANGQHATCTITNDDQPAHLIVIKHVINDNGGTANAGDFTTTITGVSTSTPTATGKESPGVDNTLTSVGSYNVDEGAHTGYTETRSADCSGTIALGETKTCTITNDDIAPQLTVIKHVNSVHGGNDAASSFTLHVTTSGTDVANSPQPGSEAGTQYTLSAGTYNVSEDLHTGYFNAGITGDCDTNGNITLHIGDVKTCTITNEDIAPTITLIKDVINNNGGLAGANDFGLTVGGANVNSGDTTAVTANTPIALSEVGLPGYNFVSITGDTGCPSVLDGTVTLDEGQNITCTITNDDVPPSLTLIKHVINDDGGSATASAWTLTATGPTTISGAGEVSSDSGFSAGTYTLSESAGPSGYTAGSWSCTGDVTNTGSLITLKNGQSATCEITNDDIAPQLTVIKHVINDNGGSLAASAFTMNVTATNPSNGSFAGAENPGTTITLDAGSYSVAETGPSGYAESDSADCKGTIAVGEHKTCTITNDDIAPQLTVIKHVVNDDGGTATAAAFSMEVNATNPSQTIFGGSENGTVITLDAGTYSVGEIGVTGYNMTGSSADCSGSIAVGETKTCTITNDDIAPTLTVNKVVVPNTDSGLFNLQIDSETAGTGTNVKDGGTTGAVATTVGTHTVGETAGTNTDLSNYTATYSGDCAANGTVSLALADIKTCTITNTRKGSITIVKDAQPDDQQAFSFGGTLGSFSLVDDGTNTNNSKAFTKLVPGSYTVSETEPNQFWVLKSLMCTDTDAHASYTSITTSGTSVTINLAAGKNVSCTFVNTKLGPTRTLGFWQTHTSFTNGIFATNFAGGMPIGAALHRGLITNITTTGQSQLFGAYYSSISKTSTGSKRSTIDQARMVLLQQLVTAKLNCAAFGCPTNIQTLITKSDADYAAGNTSQILADANLLDAYNNSGDTLAIPNLGSATPSLSKSLANIVFWNTP